MDPSGLLIGVVVIAVIAYGLFNSYQSANNRPKKGDLYACSSCGKSTGHDTRTLNGYDKGVRKSFMCWECFKKKKDAEAAFNAPTGLASSGGGSGCLGAAVLLVVAGGVGVYSAINLLV